MCAKFTAVFSELYLGVVGAQYKLFESVSSGPSAYTDAIRLCHFKLYCLLSCFFCTKCCLPSPPAPSLYYAIPAVPFSSFPITGLSLNVPLLTCISLLSPMQMLLCLDYMFS